MSKPISYRDAGVDIAVADDAKREMARALETSNARVLNRVGAFASLFDGRFPECRDPVLVLKTEEPGSKQKLAFARGSYTSICYDLINHLVNDIAVMGAAPLSVQDCIVCGKLEKSVVTTVVRAMAEACKAQGCALTGGETSEQPGVVPEGTYILSASVVGVADRASIIDGARIAVGDAVLAVASNGLHTNGYSLVRKLMERNPALERRDVDGRPFIDAILEPHFCYLQSLKPLFGDERLTGLAHITGGGVGGNLNRVLPKSMDAVIERPRIELLEIFKVIREEARVSDDVMLETYNCGVGITVVCRPGAAADFIEHFSACGLRAYPIGEIVPGAGNVKYTGELNW